MYSRTLYRTNTDREHPRSSNISLSFFIVRPSGDLPPHQSVPWVTTHSLDKTFCSLLPSWRTSQSSQSSSRASLLYKYSFPVLSKVRHPTALSFYSLQTRQPCLSCSSTRPSSGPALPRLEYSALMCFLLVLSKEK